MVYMRTLLCDIDGEGREAVLPVGPITMEQQKLGSAITYMRRYGIQIVTGIAPDDDDDAASTKHPILSPKVEDVDSTIGDLLDRALTGYDKMNDKARMFVDETLARHNDGNVSLSAKQLSWLESLAELGDEVS
jgi:hypothetical protein